MRLRLRFVLYLLIILAVGLLPNSLRATSPTRITLGFDGLPDLSLNVDGFGVHFVGAQVLECGGSLNCGPFPPFSGANVIYDEIGFGGIITATFDPSITGNVTEVSARVTGNRNITMIAYDQNGQILGTEQTGGPNYVGSNSGLPPNILLSVVSNAGPIATIVFHDSGNTFTVDDFSFTSSPQLVIVDPGHGQILRNGQLTYQRPPSKTFGLIEDVLTLDISRSVQAQLQGANIQVLLTRSTDRAPFAPADCKIINGVQCTADLLERVRWAEKQEPDLMVSVHTNASSSPTANGSESYYSPQAPSPDASSLASYVLTSVSALGLRNRGVQAETFIILKSGQFPSALIEVAFHSNWQLAPGQSITDEERLNDAQFRSQAAGAIATGIEGYYAAH